MKHLSVLITVLVVFLASCSQQDDLPIVGQSNPFTRLVEQDIYPANQLSTDAIEHFNNSFFIENGEILSGDFSLVQAELSEEEFQLLFNLIFEQEVVFVEDKIGVSEAGMKAKGGPWFGVLYNYRHKTNIGCIPSAKNFCIRCLCD